jgi:hypothetical protein
MSLRGAIPLRALSGLLVSAAVAVAQQQPIPPLDDPAVVRLKLRHLLTASDDYFAVRARRDCARGTSNPHDIVGVQKPPGVDPAAYCVVSLKRVARDGGLLTHYSELQRELALPEAAAENLLESISVAARSGERLLVFGEKTLAVTPSLAWDAGFATGYREATAGGGAAHDDNVDFPRTRLSIVDACIRHKAKSGACYKMGIELGREAGSSRQTEET